jgi:hypothetical protein
MRLCHKCARVWLNHAYMHVWCCRSTTEVPPAVFEGAYAGAGAGAAAGPGHAYPGARCVCLLGMLFARCASRSDPPLAVRRGLVDVARLVCKASVDNRARAKRGAPTTLRREVGAAGAAPVAAAARGTAPTSRVRTPGVAVAGRRSRLRAASVPVTHGLGSRISPVLAMPRPTSGEGWRVHRGRALMAKQVSSSASRRIERPLRPSLATNSTPPASTLTNTVTSRYAAADAVFWRAADHPYKHCTQEQAGADVAL